MRLRIALAPLGLLWGLMKLRWTELRPEGADFKFKLVHNGVFLT